MLDTHLFTQTHSRQFVYVNSFTQILYFVKTGIDYQQTWHNLVHRQEFDLI